MKHMNENGRSMVEMLGVLAIIGVLSVGGIAGYSKAMNKYKINKTTDQVSMLVANIRTLFSSQGNYAGLNNGQAVRFGVVPNDMYTGTATSASDFSIKNAFNGAVTIKSAPARSGSGLAGEEDAFIIVYEGLSEEACVTVATGDWGSGQASGLIGIAAGKSADDTQVNKIYVDNSSATTKTTGLVIAAPGGTGGSGAGQDGTGGSAAVTTPIKVTDAVNACNGGGAGNVVAWKYY